jgi:hypothetical protein
MIADESFCTRILGSLWWISHRARKERREQKRSRGNRKTYLLSLIVGLELRWLRGTAGSGCLQISRTRRIVEIMMAGGNRSWSWFPALQNVFKIIE